MNRPDRLIVHVLPQAFLMALTARGRLAELQIARRDRPSPVEGVFLGRLERVMPELDAAFVDRHGPVGLPAQRRPRRRGRLASGRLTGAGASA